MAMGKYVTSLPFNFSNAMKEFTRLEVAKHNTAESLWVVIDTEVYDLTSFVDLHPGGAYVLAEVAGQDATETFYALHRQLILAKYARLKIGAIAGERPQVIAAVAGALSPVPFAEPTWLLPVYHSPYYSDSHRRLQKAVRTMVDSVIYPEASVSELTGERPSLELIHAQSQVNLHAMRLGPGPHLKGLKLLADVKPEEFDYFHELVISQELSRLGGRGFADGMQGGMVIGLPPVLNFGTPELKERVAKEVFSGKKFICLAISEAFAGSDVAGLKTSCIKTKDGKHFIVKYTPTYLGNSRLTKWDKEVDYRGYVC